MPIYGNERDNAPGRVNPSDRRFCRSLLLSRVWTSVNRPAFFVRFRDLLRALVFGQDKTTPEQCLSAQGSLQ